jgi:Helix-turn-helix domain of resolvase
MSAKKQKPIAKVVADLVKAQEKKALSKTNAGRKSALSEAQWAIILERRLAGEGVSDLAKEFGVPQTTVSRNISVKARAIKAAANGLFSADKFLKTLPITVRGHSMSLVDEMKSMSMHLASAGKINAASAHRLSVLANEKVDALESGKLDREGLQEAAALLQVSNDAAKIGLNILSSQKDAATESFQPEKDIAPTAIPEDAADASKAYLLMIEGR